MKCISCNAEVPPQWVHAINSNICPGCGKEIMNEDNKQLLIELREAMSKMPNDPEGLAGWLLSNYNLHKVGTAEPTSFHRYQEKSKRSKSSDGNESEELTPEQITANERAKLFAKNAGVPNNNHLAEMAKKIKAAGSTNQPAVVMPSLNDDEDDVSDFDDDTDLDVDPQMATVANMLAGGSQETAGSKLTQAQEMQKLKLLNSRKQMKSGSGAFSRTS